MKHNRFYWFKNTALAYTVTRAVQDREWERVTTDRGRGKGTRRGWQLTLTSYCLKKTLALK